MVDLIALEKEFLSSHIKEGGVAVDFTMGNGHDTAWLSKAVGENGRVYAFDVQEKALESTRETLKAENCPDNCSLILDSHSNVLDYVKEKICVGVFNLGYLPGSGNKALTTLRPTTKKAVEAAISLLDKDAIILIAVYPGHEEGRLEGEMLDEMLQGYDRRKLCVSKFKLVNSPTSPFFFAIESK
ncbi:MAG: methyltransferase [Clostridia bacterium]|nr:methyltransferase [Clostridia bacterium]